jgi:hypothetical protein
VVVTHHVDDIPPTTTHAMLMRDGTDPARRTDRRRARRRRAERDVRAGADLERRPSAGSARGLDGDEPGQRRLAPPISSVEHSAPARRAPQLAAVGSSVTTGAPPSAPSTVASRIHAA